MHRCLVRLQHDLDAAVRLVAEPSIALAASSSGRLCVMTKEGPRRARSTRRRPCGRRESPAGGRSAGRWRDAPAFWPCRRRRRRWRRAPPRPTASMHASMHASIANTRAAPSRNALRIAPGTFIGPTSANGTRAYCALPAGRSPGHVRAAEETGRRSFTCTPREPPSACRLSSRSRAVLIPAAE
jgi:hypothetical protein